MGRLKEYFHEEIEEQFRREMIEEPQTPRKNEFVFAISVSASKVSEVHTLLMLAYQNIKAGAAEGSETIKTPQGQTISYGFRKI